VSTTPPAAAYDLAYWLAQEGLLPRDSTDVQLLLTSDGLPQLRYTVNLFPEDFPKLAKAAANLAAARGRPAEPVPACPTCHSAFKDMQPPFVTKTDQQRARCSDPWHGEWAMCPGCESVMRALRLVRQADGAPCTDPWHGVEDLRS